MAYVVSQASGSSSARALSRQNSKTPCESQLAAVLQVNEERLLARLALRVDGGRALLPLVPAVGGHQAAAGEGGPAVRGLVEQRLDAGVDHPAADRGVLGP
jgi:hypothetical protein